MIAIHDSKSSFSSRWIAYCEKNHIPYKIVCAYDDNIIAQLSDCDAFLWHHHHANPKDIQFAKQLLYSLEMAGKKVFPDFRSEWHFDDKVGQKYLFEALRVPYVPAHVFYDKRTATEWVEQTTFPQVFKLRSGAGASNVRLVKNKRQAKSLIRKAFGHGIPTYDKIGTLTDEIRKWKSHHGSFINVLKAIARIFVSTPYARTHGKERGYVYFQDFIPNQDADIRVIVTGDTAFAIKRMTRKGDFRASGSGNIVYERTEIDERCIKIAFTANDKIRSQSAAFDFIFNQQNEPLIIEVSYGYSMHGYDNCPGYWTKDMKWHEEKFCPQDWIIQNLLQKFPLCHR